MAFFPNILISILTLIVLRIWRRLTYWKSKGVPYATPILLSKKTRGLGQNLHLAHFQQRLYNELRPQGPVGGLIMFLSPSLMVMDLDLIKNILVKDFNSFPNRNAYYNAVDDPLTAHLVNLEGDEWRNLRAKLTPTFTSGKLKLMLPTMLDISDNLVTTLDKEIKNDESVEMKEMLSRFTIDVIGTVAFGLECNR